MIKVASLFSGIGGFEKGIIQANPDVEFVFSSEIDKYARQIYKKNYGVEPSGDITKINASDIPKHDILCGGFPCQAFSIAGKRRGFEDSRGTLFFEIMRIVESKRPKLLFFENVRGLLSHDKGRTFQTILRSMDDLGYDAEWQVFNSKNHGVPQNRERVFIIGHLRGSGTRPIFPITETDRQTDDIQGQRANTITSRYEGAQSTGTYIIESKLNAQIIQLNSPTHSNDRVYDSSGLSPAINCMDGGNRQPFVTVHSTLPRNSTSDKGGTGHLQREDGVTYCVDAANNLAVEVKPYMIRNSNMNGRRCKEHDDVSFTLDSSNSIGIKITAQDDSFVKFENGRRFQKDHDTNEWIKTTHSDIRRLTPTECERLQGFPDGWTEGISDTQRYKCLGNAVTVNVIEFISRHIFKMLSEVTQ